MTSTFVVTKYFDLIIELVKLFKKHGLDNERRYTLNIIIGAMAQIDRFQKRVGTPVGFRGRLDLMNAAMDGFGAVFRYFIVDGAAMFRLLLMHVLRLPLDLEHSVLLQDIHLNLNIQTN